MISPSQTFKFYSWLNILFVLIVLLVNVLGGAHDHEDQDVEDRELKIVANVDPLNSE